MKIIKYGITAITSIQFKELCANVFVDGELINLVSSSIRNHEFNTNSKSAHGFSSNFSDLSFRDGTVSKQADKIESQITVSENIAYNLAAVDVSGFSEISQTRARNVRDWFMSWGLRNFGIIPSFIAIRSIAASGISKNLHSATKTSTEISGGQLKIPFDW